MLAASVLATVCEEARVKVLAVLAGISVLTRAETVCVIGIGHTPPTIYTGYTIARIVVLALGAKPLFLTDTRAAGVVTLPMSSTVRIEAAVLDIAHRTIPPTITLARSVARDARTMFTAVFVVAKILNRAVGAAVVLVALTLSATVLDFAHAVFTTPILWVFARVRRAIAARTAWIPLRD